MVSSAYTRRYRPSNRADRMAARAKKEMHEMAEAHRRKVDKRTVQLMGSKRRDRRRYEIRMVVERNIGSWRSDWGLYKAAIGEAASREDVIFLPRLAFYRNVQQSIPEGGRGVIAEIDGEKTEAGNLKYQFCPEEAAEADALVCKLADVFASSGIAFKAIKVENAGMLRKYCFSSTTHVFVFSRAHNTHFDELGALGERVFGGAYHNHKSKARQRYIEYLMTSR